MKRNELRIFGDIFAFALAFAFLSMFSACSDDKVAGGSSDDAGIYAVKDLDVAGVSQKGPFVKGSAVTVQGIDCQTMELTGEIFEGTVKSDKGDFGVDDVNLSATCALFEVTGYYFNEVTGKKSANEVTLHALSDLSDRKHVNINMLTELEYKRVMNLVSEEKMSFADAKKQAEKEVLASFNVNGDYALSEDLNIFENGDGNAALLAVSVLVQVSGDSSKNVDVAERVDNFGTAIAENGALGDSAKTEMADWATTAESNGQIAKIRRNLENLGYAEEIASFENVVEDFATGVASSESSSSVALGAGTSSSSSSSEVKQSSSSSSVILSSSEESSNNTKESYLNPEIEYGELTDTRDGQVYKTVKIGDQVWMAENLNYENGNSLCYSDDTTECSKSGRLYIWDDAKDVCPSGWHLPDLLEWDVLYSAVGSRKETARNLKSTSGWTENGNGVDAYGFSALPVVFWDGSQFFTEGSYSMFWTSTEWNADNAYMQEFYMLSDSIQNGPLPKKMAVSVRCIMGDGKAVDVSSSSSAKSSSSDADGFDWSLAKESYLNPDINYGEITDSRDGKIYKTVKIGDQTWMAENLNYTDSAQTPSLKGGMWCYDDQPKNCDVGGAFYTWAAAVDSIALYDERGLICGDEKECRVSAKVQGICPNGWHLPDTTEWRTLIKAVGGNSKAGTVLKSQKGWDMIKASSSNGNGTDAYGFAALPVGLSNDGDHGGFSYDGIIALFWTINEASGWSGFRAISADFENVNNFVSMGSNGTSKSSGISVRCIKDYDSVASSSSSSAASSSSVEVLPPCKTETEDNCEYDTLTDDRDGRTYKTVKIGNQIWMAENLNYAYLQSTENMDSTSFCYDNDPANCDKYGRLYIWAAAMDSAGLLNDDAKGCGYDVDCSPKFPVQGVCPSGWHLPNQAEWLTLYSTVGSKSLALEALKSQNGWCNNSNGTDAFGFSGLPAGYGYEGSYGSFKNNGCYAVFWTSTGNNRWYANYEELYYEKEYLSSGNKLYSFSIRCVKN
ncbi:major paralogous domain-containing protein [Fibrobacter sp. UWB16]|uniref:fibrobacter succinogenes major paralogous domain-containing protein n=1 Tax=Fibrobacter sp. UWB16 TaxID=1945874 RepID=UPI000BCB6DCA|nr:fibrobacter succinogenes major paralogous domain-containing protein [Fibrobacter sp. UWB16]SOD15627.1 major paralogous domain-containing protein [Fibrobacter sp. UWB16]